MKKIIEFMIQKKGISFLLLAVVLFAGTLSYRSLKIDVFPDPSPVMVQIFTEADGMAAEEVEKFVSYQIETSLYGLPDVQKITSASFFGLSTVNVYFSDKSDIYFARNLIAQLLPSIKAKLPSFVGSPELGPVSTGLGMVYIYALKGKGSAMELRTLQDWVVRFRLQTIPGIAAIKSHGGSVKQFHVKVDQEKLLKYKLTLSDLIHKIEESSQNISAGYIEKNSEEYLVRGIGLSSDISDLKKISIKTFSGIPLLLTEISDIIPGEAIRRGDAILNNQGITVAGIIMKLIGVNTSELIGRLDRKIKIINKSLPKGIEVVPVYNQSIIIDGAFRTISEALIIGIILVGFILFLFLSDIYSSIVSALVIPFSLFTTFITMKILGMTADLMSVGGLAIGIGLLVDATVVVVENTARLREKGINSREAVISGVTEILRPLTYAMAIIILSFIPLITLQGVEGSMFRPFGITLLTAICSAIIYALFIAPVLMDTSRFRKNKTPGKIFPYLKKIYLKIFDFSYSRSNLTVLIFSFIFLASILAFFNTGSEFIPRLNEQTVQLEVVMPQSTSLDETMKTMTRINELLMNKKEIKTAFARVGRGEGGTHPHPVNMGNCIIRFNDKFISSAKNIEDFTDLLRKELKSAIPFALFNFTQPIRHNLDHLLTGVRADIAIKIFGTDYSELKNSAKKIRNEISDIPGVRDPQISRVSGLNEISVKIDKQKCARYNLTAKEVLDHLEISTGGRNISKIYKGDIICDVFIRFKKAYRKNIRDISNLIITNSKGLMIKLGSVADIEEGTGLTEIKRENSKRYITVQCNVSDRDVGSLVSEIRERIERKITLPQDSFYTIGGQFELKEKAEKRLFLILLITTFLIIVMLYNFLKSHKEILIILINLPVALSGGIITLWATGHYLSVPASVGFIALLGITLENTLILINFLKKNVALNSSFDKGVRESVALRLRPVLMTKFTTLTGLIPLLFSSGIGSEIQKPLALVVTGGILFSIFTTLILMPVIYKKFFDTAE